MAGQRATRRLAVTPRGQTGPAQPERLEIGSWSEPLRSLQGPFHPGLLTTEPPRLEAEVLGPEVQLRMLLFQCSYSLPTSSTFICFCLCLRLWIENVR